MLNVPESCAIMAEFEMEFSGIAPGKNRIRPVPKREDGIFAEDIHPHKRRGQAEEARRTFKHNKNRYRNQESSGGFS